jgi:hypothetical protein
MPQRIAKLLAALILMGALWLPTTVPESQPRSWLPHVGSAPGPVKILRFYASRGLVITGETAELCYGVENAKSVRISPPIAGVYPSPKHCIEVVPEHTTHYTILAEGFDGKVAMQSLTLPVQSAPQTPERVVHYAEALPPQRYRF